MQEDLCHKQFHILCWKASHRQAQEDIGNLYQMIGPIGHYILQHLDLHNEDIQIDRSHTFPADLEVHIPRIYCNLIECCTNFLSLYLSVLTYCLNVPCSMVL